MPPLTRTLYLHLGPTKTGTSAIQYALSRHDGSSVLYPKVGLWPDGSHHNLVLNFFDHYQRRDVIRADAGQLLAQIGELARDSNRDVAISSEILSARRDLKEFVDALQRHIGGEALRVELLVLVREHFERAASLYNQRVKDPVSAERRDPDLFLVEQAKALRYAPLLQRLGKSGFDLTVLNYHPAESCVARALLHLGIPRSQIPDVPPRNVSLSIKVLIAVLAANRLALGESARKECFLALGKVSACYAPSRFIFGAGAAAEAERIFAEDRHFVRERFGIELPVPDLVRSDAFIIERNEFDEISESMRDFGVSGPAVLDGLRPYLRRLEP